MQIQNPDQLTPAAQKILLTGLGYRCLEQASGYHEPADVLNYEINELANDDIPDTVKQLYHYDYQTVEQLVDFINDQLDTQQFELIWLASDPLDCIEFYSDHHQRYQTLAAAKHDDGTPIPVAEYLLPIDETLLISDCGVDGQLFAYPADLTIAEKTIN